MAQATASLILHKGARLVDETELRGVQTPPPEGRWFPIPHVEVLERVRNTLDEAGFEVGDQQIALSRNNARFFGTLTLKSTVAENVHLAIGVRSSWDRSFPLACVGGNKTVVCDNLLFRSDLLNVKRRHSTNGAMNFQNDIAGAIQKLGQFQIVERERIAQMMNREVSDIEADSLILNAYERGIISSPYLARIIREWRKPTFAEFEPRTAWSLISAFTTVLGERAQRNPSEYSIQTMRLNSFVAKSTALTIPV
jgi:hypothetical protein